MLKTLGTKLAKLKKSIVKVGDSKKKHDNRAELVGRDEIDDNEVQNNEVGKKN